MKYRIRFLRDERKWNDKSFSLAHLLALLLIADKRAYTLKKYLDGYEVFDGSKKVGYFDNFGNVATDDSLYFKYKQNVKTRRDEETALINKYLNSENVTSDFKVEETNAYLNKRTLEEITKQSAAARNNAIAGSARIIEDRYGKKIQTQAGVKTPTEFAEYLYNIYKKEGVFDKWHKIITEWYLSGELAENNLTRINQFVESVSLLARDHRDEYDENFNGNKPDDIIRRFSKNVREEGARARAAAAAVEKQKTDYEVILVDSATKAKQYCKYTDWCITRGSYSSYVGKDDPNKAETFYFLAKKGFENVPRKAGPGTPKDEYGLSFIAISIKENGGLYTSTTRWNHENGGNDNMFTPAELGRLAGGNFYEIFKPLTTAEERYEKIVKSNRVERKVGNNKIVNYNNRLYLINDGKVVESVWGGPIDFIVVKDVPGKYLVGRGREDWYIISADLVLIYEGEMADAKAKIKTMSGN